MKDCVPAAHLASAILVPARTGELKRLMEDNGYPRVAVHRYAGFRRPLLVGSALASLGG